MIKKKLIQQAVSLLRELNEKHFEDISKKKPLLENEKECTLFLQVTLKKIPQQKLIKMIKINLPHPLLRETNEVCLILGDQDKKNHKAEIEPDVLHYKQLLKKHGISQVSEVMTLRQLRTDYKPYEAKLKLLAAYDVFLADKKIAECLPRILGRHFIKKRKLPIQIDMKVPNLKQQIEKALSTKVLHITGHGNSCCSEIAYLDMDDLKIQKNILAVAKALSEQLPGSWDNIMGIYLKTARSSAIPLYMSYNICNEFPMVKEEKEEPIIADLSTISDLKVKVYSDGTVEAFRSTELSEIEDSEDEDVLKEIVKENSKHIKKEKVMEGSSLAESNDINKNSEIEVSEELVKKTKGLRSRKKKDAAKCNISKTELIQPTKLKKESKILQPTNEDSSLQKDFDTNELEVIKETKKSKRNKKEKSAVEHKEFNASKNELNQSSMKTRKRNKIVFEESSFHNEEPDEKVKMTKRKRSESESQPDNSEMPLQQLKKRKIELNVEKIETKKEVLKNKKKRVNRLRHKI